MQASNLPSQQELLKESCQILASKGGGTQMVLHLFFCSIHLSKEVDIIFRNRTTRIIYTDNLLPWPKEYEREGDMKDLIKIRPAVRTTPPISHEALSPTGMSPAHLWNT